MVLSGLWLSPTSGPNIAAWSSFRLFGIVMRCDFGTDKVDALSQMNFGHVTDVSRKLGHTHRPSANLQLSHEASPHRYASTSDSGYGT